MAADNVVSIDIMVRDGGTLSVLDTTGAKLKTLEASAAGASREVQGVGASFGTVGSGVEAMGRATEKTEGLRGSLREVRGEARELGLNLGYSMTHFLAQSPAVMSALRAIEGVFIGIAAIDIGAQLIEGVHHLYEKWFDVTKAVEAYEQKATEAAEQKLFDIASLEETRDLITEIGDQITVLEDKKKLAGADQSGPLGIPGGFLQTFQGMRPIGRGPMEGAGAYIPRYTAADDEANAKAQENQDKLTEHKRQGEQRLDQELLRGQAAYDAAVTQGYAHISAHEKDTVAEINQRYDQMKQQEENLVKIHNDGIAKMKAAGKDVSQETVETADPHAFEQERGAAINAARQEAAGQRIAMARKESEEVIRLQNEAIDAGMRGEALHDEERQQAIDAVTRAFEHSEISKQTAAAKTEALDMLFHNQKMVRLQEEEYATKKIQEQASQAGLTGIPKIQAETQSRINELTENPANASLSAQGVKDRTAAFQQQGNQQIIEAQKQLAEETAQIVQRSNDQQLQGYARLAAGETALLSDLQQRYKRAYGDDENTWQGYQDTKTAIQQAAEHERQKLSEDVDRQISQTEAEAARSLLPPWQAAQQKIEDDYRQRLEKIREDVEQHVVTEEQGAREVQAAWALANSEMERATMQERDRLASQLSSFFDNPAKYMQQRAKQVMFDIMANWMQQLEQNNPRMQGAIGAMFGLNPVGTGSPQHALGQLFGAHSATHDQSGLTNASSTLISAGSTLSASGTMLASSAAALTQAATVWESALYNQSSGGGAGGGSFSGWTGESSSSGAGSDSFWLGGGGSGGGGGIFGGGGASPSFGGAGGAGGGSGTAELSEVLGIPPQLASMIPGGNAIGSTLGLYQGFSKLFSSSGGSGAQLLNPSGGFQPSDINQAPTNSAGVLGTVPGGAASDDNGSAGSSALGEIGGVVSGGMTAYSGLSAAWNSSNVGSGLIGAGETALGGAEIGMTVGGPMGAIIGGITGFAAGLTADLIGDHGLSKARHYNTMTVEPALQQLMYEDYDSAMLGMNNLQIQAQKQTAQWGSGAAEYYHSTILPEITNAEAQVTREGRAGRDNVTTSAAQFHGGGWVDDFLDLATSDTEGFIHARQGEYMMHDAAASTNAPWLEAMNRGLDLTSALAPALAPGGAVPHETNAAGDYLSPGRGAQAAGGPAGSGGAPPHIHIHAIDVRDFVRFLRGGGAMAIQTELNRNTARFSGKALSS